MTIPDLLRAALEAHVGTATVFETAWTMASAYGVCISLVSLREARVSERESRNPDAIFDMVNRDIDVESVQISARGFVRNERVRLYVKAGFALFGVHSMLTPALHGGGTLRGDIATAAFALFAISLVAAMDWQSASDRDDRRRIEANAARAHEEDG